MTVLRDETARIRRATSHDAEQIAALVAEHAEYERGEARPEPQALAQALQGSPARIVAWIVEQAGEPLGYAAVTEDFSTWRARPFLHLDCLFVRAQYRGRGIGADLFREAQRHAREQGLVTLEWQTPHWNGDAIRFYERMGGRYAVKARFTLDGLELEL